MTSDSPLAVVRRLSEEHATGELICALGGLEVHVYLQQGRIAWATSSAARFAFARELLRRCDVDPNTLQELVEDCRRNRRPLGETLVSWSLASFEDVRESLRLQIRDALATLAERVGAPKLFLERGEQYLAYEKTLTFGLDELLDDDAADAETDTQDDASRILDRLFDDVPEIRWAEVIEGDERVAARPSSGSRDRATRELAALAFGDGVELAIVRGSGGTTIGLARDDGSSIWLGLGCEARLGSVFGALGDLVSAPRAPSEPLASEVSVEGLDCDACAPLLRDVLARWTDAEAACVLHGDVPTVVHRRGVDGAALVARALARTPMLSVEGPGVTGSSAASRSVALGLACTWSLAAPVPDESGRVLWLSISREASQGLAWALLSATARQIAQVACVEPSR